MLTPILLAPAAIADTVDCNNIVPGKPLASTPWPQNQLDYEDAWQITQGQYVTGGTFDGQTFAAGDPVPIAVVDSGFNGSTVSGAPNPVFEGADIHLDTSVLPTGSPDCVGHGTEVTSIISAQQNGSSDMVGVAPQASVLAIKYTNESEGGSSTLLAAALKVAIDAHVRVINLSTQLVNPPIAAVMTELQAAERAGIIIVAAGGNDSAQGNGPYYPAALSTTFPNIIAVSAVGQDGQSASFGVTGSYVDIAAPGVNVPVAQRLGGFSSEQGTSYATPFVTGTVALMLAAHPDMTPAEVKQRLEATADPPPGTVPDSMYGYGTLNVGEAVTSSQDDSVTVPSPRPGPALPAPGPVHEASRTLDNRALGIGFGLLALAALTVTTAAVLRASKVRR